MCVQVYLSTNFYIMSFSTRQLRYGLSHRLPSLWTLYDDGRLLFTVHTGGIWTYHVRRWPFRSNEDASMPCAPSCSPSQHKVQRDAHRYGPASSPASVSQRSHVDQVRRRYAQGLGARSHLVQRDPSTDRRRCTRRCCSRRPRSCSQGCRASRSPPRSGPPGPWPWSHRLA